MIDVQLLQEDPPLDGIAIATDWMTKIIEEGDLNTWYVFSADGEKPFPMSGALVGPMLNHFTALADGWETRRQVNRGKPDSWFVYVRKNEILGRHSE